MIDSTQTTLPSIQPISTSEPSAMSKATDYIAYEEALTQCLTARGFNRLVPAVLQLLRHVEPAYLAMGAIYDHPAQELIEELLQWDVSFGFRATSETGKVASLASFIANDVSLGQFAASARNSDSHWIPHLESYSDFVAAHEGESIALFYKHDDGDSANTLIDWLCMHGTPKH